MDTQDDWTPEERAAIRHLLGTPGWDLVMRHHLIPMVQQMTVMLDRPAIDQAGHGDYLRGQKRAYMQLIAALYTAARLQNPLDAHALGLLRAVSHEPTPPPDTPSPSPAAGAQERRYGRSQPV